MAETNNCATCKQHTGVIADVRNLKDKVGTMEKIGVAILIALFCNLLGVVVTLATLLGK